MHAAGARAGAAVNSSLRSTAGVRGNRMGPISMTNECSRRAILAVLLAALAACTPAGPGTPASGAKAWAASATAAPLAIQPWPLPVLAGSVGAAQPDLIRAPDGSLLLSWIEHRAQGHALYLARHRDGTWHAPRLVAQGRDWFVNWAD